MKTHVVTIPFPQLKPLLPKDGERIVVWQGATKWPGNSTPFERKETLEIAFGKAIRAQAKHRKGETWCRPGFSAGLGVLDIRGGFAAHKQVPVHNDYFDGTFHATVQASVSAGRVRCKVLGLSLHWNASLAARLLDVTGLIRRFLLDIVEQKVVAMLNQRIEAAIVQVSDELQRRMPGATAITRAITLVVLPGQLMLSIQYEEKAAPKRFVAVARKVSTVARKRAASAGVAAKTRASAATAARSASTKAPLRRRTGKS